MRPIIGITAGHSRNEYGQSTILLADAYLQAILGAGGIPVLVPASIAGVDDASVYSKLDGILFSGGGDIAPVRFGGEPHPRIADVDAPRDELELALLQRAVADGKPFLGICRGFQLVNVGLGGTLYTHLPDQFVGALHHDNPGDKRHDLVHEVELERQSRLGEIVETVHLAVNSHHHQGLKDLAPGLRATGHTKDGLIESVELGDHPFGLAVQWHPEWLTDMDSTRKLFHRFVQASAEASG